MYTSSMRDTFFSQRLAVEIESLGPLLVGTCTRNQAAGADGARIDDGIARVGWHVYDSEGRVERTSGRFRPYLFETPPWRVLWDPLNSPRQPLLRTSGPALSLRNERGPRHRANCSSSYRNPILSNCCLSLRPLQCRLQMVTAPVDHICSAIPGCLRRRSVHNRRVVLWDIHYLRVRLNDDHVGRLLYDRS